MADMTGWKLEEQTLESDILLEVIMRITHSTLHLVKTNSEQLESSAANTLSFFTVCDLDGNWIRSIKST
ncbi:unnamed protein product [Caretta caretta]